METLYWKYDAVICIMLRILGKVIEDDNLDCKERYSSGAHIVLIAVG